MVNNISELKNLIYEGESKYLEFKTSTSSIKGAFESVCAFLNNNGGTVIIGVTDKGKIVGQEVSDETKLKIAHYISQIEPSHHIDVKYISIQNHRQVIILKIDTGYLTPPYALNGSPYWRVESSTVKMPQDIYKTLLLDSSFNKNPWDSEIAVNVNVKNLDNNLIIETINNSISKGRLDSRSFTNTSETALQRLKLTSNGKLLNSAIILFCKEVPDNYSQCTMHLARFKGYNKREAIDNKIIFGNAFTLLYEAEQFIHRHTSIKGNVVPEAFMRKEVPDYPTRAIREAIINAICHRHYSQQGSINVIIYDDRMEISSPGCLPPGINIMDLKNEHESHPRNPKITHVLYLTGFVESIGTGTEEIIRECKQQGLVSPDYFERSNYFVVRFWNQLSSEMTERQKLLLILLRGNISLKNSEIIKLLPEKLEPRTIRRDLNALVNIGVVQLDGTGATAIWSAV